MVQVGADCVFDSGVNCPFKALETPPSCRISTSVPNPGSLNASIFSRLYEVIYIMTHLMNGRKEALD